jgi:hypothetical protein
MFCRAMAFVDGSVQRCIEGCFVACKRSLHVDKTPLIAGACEPASKRKRSSSAFALEDAKRKLIQEKQ